MKFLEKAPLSLSFWIFWSGQLLSSLGSELTRFAIPIWVFKETDNNVYLSLLVAAAFAPKVLFGLFGGALVDILPRRRLLWLSEGGQTIGTLCYIPLAFRPIDEVTVGLLICLQLINGCFGTMSYAGMSAVTRDMVAPDSLTRANGMMVFIESTVSLAGPILGGLMITSLGLPTIFIADGVSFVFGLVSLLAVVAPVANSEAAKKGVTFKACWDKLKEGVVLILSMPGLAPLLVVSSFTNFIFSLSFTLLTPYVLTVTGNAEATGRVFAVGGLAQAASALFLGFVPSPKSLVRAELIGILIMGLFGPLLIGAVPNAWGIAAGYFFTMLIIPTLNTFNRSAWQRAVPPEFQGRTAAGKRSISGALALGGTCIAGTLVNDVFTPLLGSPKAGYQGAFIAAGATLSIIAALCLVSPGIRGLDLRTKSQKS